MFSLTDLYMRCKNKGYGKKIIQIIQKYYLILIQLYQFNPDMINNYVMLEVDNIDLFQDFFALLANLRADNVEIAIFNKILELSPKFSKKYEDLDSEESRNAIHAQLKECMYGLKLMAIANELNAGNVKAVKLSEYNNNGSKPHMRLINDMALSLRSEFYSKFGITVDPKHRNVFDERFMVDIVYAYENLNGYEQTFLVIMLKTMVYQLNIRDLFSTSSGKQAEGEIEHKVSLTEEKVKNNFIPKFSNKERAVLKNIDDHNVKVENKFIKKQISWDVWQNGVLAVEGPNVSVSLWKRDVSNDLFQGEFCNSCISLVKGNARANLHYLADFNFSMIEIISNKTNKTIGHVTVWIGKQKKQKILVLNSIQVHRQYEKFGAEIRTLVFNYAQGFSQKLGIERFVLGNSCNSVPVDVLRWIDGEFNKPNKTHKIELEEFKIKIIKKTLVKEFYSDIYYLPFGWIDCEGMENKNAQVWDISLFLKQATLLTPCALEMDLPQALKYYGIWILKNPRSDYKLIKDHKLLFISEAYLQKNRSENLKKIASEVEVESKRENKQSHASPERSNSGTKKTDALSQKWISFFASFPRLNWLDSKTPHLSEHKSQSKINSKEKDKKFASKKAMIIGPRKVSGWRLKDVEGKGNCFYLADADQLRFIKHKILKEIPSGTAVHDVLRLRVQGLAFQDKEWADYPEILALCKKLNCVVAIADTRKPFLGFVYYSTQKNGHLDIQRSLRALSANKPVIQLAFTGNHYLSVQSSLELEGVISVYTSSARKVTSGFWVGQLPKNLREIDKLIIEIKCQECSEKMLKIKLMDIIQYAKKLGHRHPILNAAQKCLGSLENSTRANETQASIASGSYGS